MDKPTRFSLRKVVASLKKGMRRGDLRTISSESLQGLTPGIHHVPFLAGKDETTLFTVRYDPSQPFATLSRVKLHSG